MKKGLSLLMMLMLAVGAWAATVDLAYPGGTTTNMTGGNDAALVGLDATAWSVIGDKGGNNNYPGLNQAGDLRLYWSSEGGNTLTVSSLNGATINSITFEFTGANYSNAYVEVDGEQVTATNGVYEIGSSSFVVGNANTSNVQVRIKKITIDYSDGATPSVATPVIAGETPFTESTQVTITCNTEGAAIYYTINGTDPTNQSTVYTEPFTLTESATVKAIAYDATGATSSIASKEFVKEEPVVLPEIATVAEIKALEDEIEFVFTGRLVASGHAHSGNNNWLFAQDETGGIQIFKAPQDYEQFDVIPAGFTATKKTYGGAVQLQNITNMQAATETQELTPEELTPAQVTLDNVFEYAVIKGATIADNNITVGDESVVIYNNRFNTTIPTDGAVYDVIGITSYFNTTNQFMPLEFVPQGVEVATPVITGETPFTESTQVTITCETEGAAIYYTIDGTEPTDLSTAYTEPFTLTESATVKAIAYDATGAVSQVATKAFEKQEPAPTCATVAEILALEDETVFTFTGNLVVSAQTGQYLYAQDETGGLLLYGTAPAYEKGDVIPAGWGAEKVMFRGAPEVKSLTGMAEATETAEITAAEMTPAQVTVEPYNLFFYGVIKGATIDGSILVVGEESVATYNRFGVTAPDDVEGKTYDVYGIPGWFNNAQFMPLEYVEVPVVLEKTESPTIAVIEGEISYTFFVNGLGELKLYANGEEVEIPYIVERTDEDQVIVLTATAQEDGKDISDPTVLTVTVPKLDMPVLIEELYVVGDFNNWNTETGLITLVENDNNEFVGSVNLEANGRFKIITPNPNATSDDDQWIWFGGEDDNNVGYFEVNEDMLGISIDLIDGSDFKVVDAGNYTITVMESASQILQSVQEPLVMIITKNDPQAIDNINMENVKAVRFYNMQGIESATPFHGVNIVVREMNDGTKNVTKMVK